MSGSILRVGRHFADDVARIEPIGGGLINDTYEAFTESGSFILQRMNPSVFDDAAAVIANILTVIGHVDDDILARLRPTKTGIWSVTDDGAVWRAWDRVDADPTDMVVTAGRTAAAARLLARFHTQVSGLDPARMKPTFAHFHDPAWHLAEFERVLVVDPVGHAAAVGGEADVIRRNADLASLGTELNHLHGGGIAHNDAKLTNMLFRGDDAVCLIDLDTLLPTGTFWDVADLVRSAADSTVEDDPDSAAHQARPELIATILDAYRDVRPGGAELEGGCVVIAFEQAVRFVTDWLRGDVYWKATSPTQNLDRARGQLTLMASLREVVGW